MPRQASVFLYLALAMSLVAVSSSAEAGKKAVRKAAKAETKRKNIDAMSEETLTRLFADSARAKKLHQESLAWAVFDNAKVSLGLTAGGGQGVAVNKESGKRTYMKMATGGVNVGLGVQRYRVIFMFNDADVFKRFVKHGWEADASANAAAGRAGANAGASFNNGLAVFQMTEAGLMLQADLSGTKYWKNKKLN